MDIFGIGPTELVFIILIALIILGPKDMQKTGRTIGRFLRNLTTSDGWRVFRDTSREIRNIPNRLMREAPTKSKDPVYIGRRLDIEAFWAEKCLLAYGRRVTRPVQLSEERRDELQEAWESWPGEEVAREDREDIRRHVDTKPDKVPDRDAQTGYEGFQFRKEDPDRPDGDL